MYRFQLVLSVQKVIEIQLKHGLMFNCHKMGYTALLNLSFPIPYTQCDIYLYSLASAKKYNKLIWPFLSSSMSIDILVVESG